MILIVEDFVLFENITLNHRKYAYKITNKTKEGKLLMKCLVWTNQSTSKGRVIKEIISIIWSTREHILFS